MSVSDDAGESWRPMKIGGLWSSIGPLLARRDGDGWRYAVQAGEAHANPIGLVHGGALAALLDHAMSLTAYAACDRQPAVTIQMETRFLAAARPGELLEAVATLRRRAGATLFLDAEIAVGDRAVACGSAVMKLARKDDGGGEDG